MRARQCGSSTASPFGKLTQTVRCYGDKEEWESVIQYIRHLKKKKRLPDGGATTFFPTSTQNQTSFDLLLLMPWRLQAREHVITFPAAATQSRPHLTHTARTRNKHLETCLTLDRFSIPNTHQQPPISYTFVLKSQLKFNLSFTLKFTLELLDSRGFTVKTYLFHLTTTKVFSPDSSLHFTKFNGNRKKFSYSFSFNFSGSVPFDLATHPGGHPASTH